MSQVEIDSGRVSLPGELTVPPDAVGIAVFAHGSGSTRLSPRNVAVARALNERGIATLLFDLLTPAEANDRGNVFDIDLLSDRLEAATRWATTGEGSAGIPVGLFGASTGAAPLWSSRRACRRESPLWSLAEGAPTWRARRSNGSPPRRSSSSGTRTPWSWR